MIYLYDNSLRLTKAIDEKSLVSAHVIDEINLITFTAEALDEKVFSGAFYVGVYHPDEPDNYLLFKLVRLQVDTTRVVLGVHVFYDDLKGRYVKDIRQQGKPVSTALAMYLDGTGWEIGTYSSTKTTEQSAYYVSSLEAVSKLIEETGVIIRPVIRMAGGKIISKTVRVSDTIGTFSGRRFRHGVDGVQVTYAEESTELYTALVGRGAGIQKVDEETGEWSGGYTRRIMFTDEVWKRPGKPVDKPAGQAWVEMPERTALYGYPNGTPRIGILTLDKVEDPAVLLQKTYEELERVSRPKLTFRVSRANAEGVKLGDEVVAIRDKLSFRTSIFMAKHNLKNRELTEFEFGDKVVSAISSQVQKINSTIAENEARNLSIMAKMQYQLDSYYWGEDGYNYDIKPDNKYQLPAGYYSFNKPIDDDPTKVIYIGAGKMLISNAKDAAGKWIWKTAATGDGFLAESMFADYIRGNLIRGSVIESTAIKDGSPVSYWNLDTGKLKAEDGEFYGSLYVDSKKYGYQRYNVGEWLDELQDLITKVDRQQDTLERSQSDIRTIAEQARSAANTANTALSEVRQLANSARSRADTAYSTAGNAWTAAGTAQQTANEALRNTRNVLSMFGSSFNANGYPSGGITRIQVVNVSGRVALEVFSQYGVHHVYLN